MQKANGLQLKFGGASYSSLMSGMVLGYVTQENPHCLGVFLVYLPVLKFGLFTTYFYKASLFFLPS